MKSDEPMRLCWTLTTTNLCVCDETCCCCWIRHQKPQKHPNNDDWEKEREIDTAVFVTNLAFMTAASSWLREKGRFRWGMSWISWLRDRFWWGWVRFRWGWVQFWWGWGRMRICVWKRDWVFFLHVWGFISTEFLFLFMWEGEFTSVTRGHMWNLYNKFSI
jgi:hypothetical protein